MIGAQKIWPVVRLKSNRDPEGIMHSVESAIDRSGVVLTRVGRDWVYGILESGDISGLDDKLREAFENGGDVTQEDLDALRDELLLIINSASGVGYFLHEQTATSTVWTVQHDLGTRPLVSVVDDAGEEITCRVVHLDLDSLECRFSATQTGEATCLTTTT